MLLEIMKRLDRTLGLRNRMRGMPPSGFDLNGEKALDWGWCITQLPQTPKQRVLDIGCAQAPITPAAIMLGHEVTGIDIDILSYSLPGLTFIGVDFMEADLGDKRFDIVVLSSVVEHIGLVGRYGQRDIPDGDLGAMRKVLSVLKPDGRLILTIPIGRDLIFQPWHRIYGEERLPQLLRGFLIEREQYYWKPLHDTWRITAKADALQVDQKGLCYALGQMVLTPERA
jgi:SAM-dependent methyltransferase